MDNRLRNMVLSTGFEPATPALRNRGMQATFPLYSVAYPLIQSFETVTKSHGLSRYGEILRHNPAIVF